MAGRRGARNWARSTSRKAITSRATNGRRSGTSPAWPRTSRSEEHTSELQSHVNLVCRLLLEKKKKKTKQHSSDNHWRTMSTHLLSTLKDQPRHLADISLARLCSDPSSLCVLYILCLAPTRQS